MTSTFTMLCPEGIVMATDSRISYPMYPDKPWKRIFKDGITKIYELEEKNVGISYWGQAEFEGKSMLTILGEFRKSKINKEDDVDSIAEKLKMYLEGMSSKIEQRMGLHVAGYVKEVPKLRHVFHESWHNIGEFVNENCHAEYHTSDGDKVSYREPKEYPVLFNGDNVIANALFNYAPRFHPYFAIVPHKLKLVDCVELAKLIISTSIHRLNYYFDQLMQQSQIPKDVGWPICMATITQESFDLKKYDRNTEKKMEV